jgi:Protein of unknown function (DUF3592)
MSNHAARPRLKKSIYLGFERSDLAALILALVIGLVLLGAHFWRRDSRLNWPSVRGQVIETRIAVLNIIEQEHQPGMIVYQVEAHVTYERDGKQYESWLPVPKRSTDKAFLEFWLSQKKSKACTVRWPPKNPSYVEAALY